MNKSLLLIVLLFLIQNDSISSFVQPIHKLEIDDDPQLSNPPIKIALSSFHNISKSKSLSDHETTSTKSNVNANNFNVKQQCDENSNGCLASDTDAFVGALNYDLRSHFYPYLRPKVNDHIHLIQNINQAVNYDYKESEEITEEKLPDFLINWKSIARKFEEYSIFFLPIPYSLDVSKNKTSDDFSPRSKNKDDDDGTGDYAEDYTAEESSTDRPDVEFPDISDQCSRDVEATFHVFRRKFSSRMWNLKLMDSWGKSRDGILIGNKAMGFFEECLGVTAAGRYKLQKFSFTGQHCVVNLLTEMVLILPSRYGTCIPSSCTADELQDSLNYQLAAFNSSATDVKCQQRDEPLPSGSWVVAGCVVIGVMTLAVLLGTVVDFFFKKKAHPIFKAFSATENMGKIMAVKINDPREISCINGIRVLSICWVVIGHQYVFIPQFSSNKFEFPELTSPWPIQIIWNGYRAVDTFFVIGGVLLTKGLLASNFCIASDPDIEQEKIKGFFNTLLLKSIQAQGAMKTITKFVFTYAYFIFHRIVRVLPAILLITMFCAGPSEWFVSGPYFHYYQTEYLEPCRYNWWVDLSFFSNFVYVFHNAHSGEPGAAPLATCVPQSWYLAVDFQLYLVAPFLILPVKFLKYKLSYLAILTLISCLIPGIIVLAKELMPTFLFTLNYEATTDFFVDIYMMPYTRASPYFIGAICAILLDRIANKEEGERWWKPLSNKVLLWIGWIVCTICVLTILFCLEDVNKIVVRDSAVYPHLSKFGDFMYASFAIAVWCACVGWIMVVCTLGKGGPIGTFLSHPMWQPCSRITFSVYLISLPMQYMIFYSIQQYIYVTHLSIFLSCGGVLMFSFLAAFPISVIAEAPFINLLKIIRKK